MLLGKSQSAMPEVPVNGKVLQWARTIRGLDLDKAAELLGITPDELHAYESGAKKPLVGVLRNMSSKYRINFTSLLMPAPLPIRKPPTDHRMRHGERPLSIDTLVAIEEVIEALETFEDIADEDGRIVPRLNIGTASLNGDAEDIATRERRKLGVSIEEQWAWRSLAEARVQWRQRIEARGVFTYMIPLGPPDEVSGFSLLHDHLAAICVNDREPTEGAKIFTLFHEYCHLLLRQTGISDENDRSHLERFCNEFAACFLIPKTPLIDATGDIEIPHEFSDAEVKRLATRFRVSNRAMALRLEKTGLAPRGFYERRTGPWDLPSEPRPVTSRRQPDYIRIRLKRIGRLHASTVLRAVDRRVINSFDASELLEIQPGAFGKVKATLGW